MLAGPLTGCTAVMTVAGAATLVAVDSMARVIDAVVLGLTISRFIGLSVNDSSAR